jgi:putative phage-type endonuclease
VPLSEEQLKMRQTGISGSELAAVCGLSPWENPATVWERKVGLRQVDLSLNNHVIRGNLLERPMVEWYSIMTGRSVQLQTTLRHPQHDIIMATPDGIASIEGEEDVCLEIKCPSIYTMRHWTDEEDGIPTYYLPQVTAQMAVTGLKMAHVFMYDNIEPRIYRVPYDAEFFEALREVAERFWHDHVLTRKPPPPDNTHMYAEFIARFCPQAEEREVLDLTQHTEATMWLEKLRQARSTREQAEKAEALAQNHLKTLMGSHAYARLNGAQLSWKNTKPVERVQWKDLAKKADIPEALIKAHTKTSEPPRPFKVRWETHDA